MNSSQPNSPWTRLAAAARTAPDTRDTAAPYAFSTRIAALAMAQERKVVSLMERFALRALCAAALLAVLGAVVNYPAINSANATAEDEQLFEDDPVAVLLDV